MQVIINNKGIALMRNNKLKEAILSINENFELALDSFSIAVSLDTKFIEAIIDYADCLTRSQK